MFDRLKGTGVAIVTPFNEDKSVDYEGLKNLINHIIDGGVNYVVVQGTTGESVTLTKNEKKEILGFCVEVVDGRTPVVFGLGGNNTLEVLEQFSEYNFDGVDALLSVSPFYNKPTQEGIYQHYKAIAKESPLPIILYNVPGRTGSNVAAETTIKLAKEFNNIIAVKEASGDLIQISKIVKNAPSNFMVISGDDGLTLPILSVGGSGVISVVANALPSEFSDMVNAALDNDYLKAKELHGNLIDFSVQIFEEGNPAGVKAALEILGVCKKNVRLPLVSASISLCDTIENTIQQLRN
jgi:4-hydroxy-tetrahydrodipicolinate synthase